MKLTRRSVAGALLTAPLGAGTARAQGFAPQLATGGLRVRKSVSAMAPNDPDLEALRYAVGHMRTDTGPLSWLTQRQVHAAPWGHHNSWRFLPWHRFQLYYLERIIARVSGKPDFAMPYWNWDDDRVPAAYLQRRSPLFDNTRTVSASSRISTYLGFEWAAGAGDGDFWGQHRQRVRGLLRHPEPDRGGGCRLCGIG